MCRLCDVELVEIRSAHTHRVIQARCPSCGVDWVAYDAEEDADERAAFRHL